MADAKNGKGKASKEPLFSVKKWNAVAMWSWDVECDTCAICKVHIMGEAPLNRTHSDRPTFVVI